MQYVVSLSFASLCYFLIHFCFSIFFLFYFLVLYVRFLFSVFCVFVPFCVLFLLVYIAVSFLLLYKFTEHCHRVETQLQWINIISHHILSSYVTSHCINTNSTYGIWPLSRGQTFKFWFNVFWPCIVIYPYNMNQQDALFTWKLIVHAVGSYYSNFDILVTTPCSLVGR